jgi:hypothetical protein
MKPAKIPRIVYFRYLLQSLPGVVAFIVVGPEKFDFGFQLSLNLNFAFGLSYPILRLMHPTSLSRI